MATLVISRTTASALGDVRNAGPGDMILLRPLWATRADGGRYAGALAEAIQHGADVRNVGAR